MGKFRNKLLEMVEDGLIDPVVAFRDALNYMSEDEAEQFGIQYGYLNEEEEDEDEDENA
jgi:hypothetical protein